VSSLKSVFERILAPDFVYILDDPEHLSEGRVLNKQEYIAYEASVGKNLNKYSTAEGRNLKVRAYGGDTAVSTGEFHVTGFDQKGKKFDRVSRFINVWVEHEGSWQAVVAQNTWSNKN
jgi:ketosteroid isomerase-like protein